MTTKLQIYNSTLVEHLGERKLDSLTENREPRRVLDHFWDDGFVDGVLEQGYWNFATRSVRVDYDPDFTSSFGYRYAFPHPSDWIRSVMVCSDEYFRNPIRDYAEEGGKIFCDHQTIYLKYISNDAEFGGDLSKWPESFSSYASAELALKATKRLTMSDADKERLKMEVKKLKADARSKDAMNEETGQLPRGSWSTARTKGRGTTGRHDLGWS